MNDECADCGHVRRSHWQDDGATGAGLVGLCSEHAKMTGLADKPAAFLEVGSGVGFPVYRDRSNWAVERIGDAD